MDVLSIAGIWAAFAATHMGLSSQTLRPRLIATLGGAAFQGVYSLIALALFALLCVTYFANQHAGPQLWYFGGNGVVRWLAYLGISLSLTILVGGLLTPSPAGIVPTSGEVRGALRISRHPLFMAAGMFGLFHLLTANVHATELAFFGGFPLFAVIGCAHQDRRKQVGDAGYRAFCAQTAFLPFAQGKQALRGLSEMPLALAIGIGLAVFFRVFHSRWFGGIDWLGWAS